MRLSLNETESIVTQLANNPIVGMPAKRKDSADLVVPHRGKRLMFLITGLVCAAIAAGGAFVPLVPTTFPLIVASFCLVRSSPVLERKLLRNRFFGPYMKYLDASEPMPLKAKVISLAMMWVGVGVGAFFIARSEAPSWLLVVQAVLALIGTVAILRWGRSSKGDRSRDGRRPGEPAVTECTPNRVGVSSAP